MKTDIAFDVKYKLGYQILKNKKHLDFNPYSIVNLGSIFNTLAVGTEFSYKVRKTNQDLPNPITYAFSGEVDTVFFTRNLSLSNQKKLKKVNNHIYKKNHSKTIEDIEIYDKNLNNNDSIPLIDSLDANVINFVLNTKYGAPVKKNKTGGNKFKKKYNYLINKFYKINPRLYVDAYIKFIGYNAFLSGGIFNKLAGVQNPYEIKNSDINRFVYNFRLGTDIEIYSLTLGYFVAYRSQEIKLENSSSQLFGGFRLQYNFR